MDLSCDCVEIKVEEMYLSPTGTQTHVSHMSGSNGPVQYLNVRQRKLGTFILQTVQSVHILQRDSVNTGSLPKDNASYFQITKPGSSSVTPPYQWNNCTALLSSAHAGTT